MNWSGYFVSFSIESPIFIGYNVSGDAERTRHYIPANNMMGALAHAIEKEGRPVSMAAMDQCFSFSTFFVSKDGEGALFPSLDEGGGLSYGPHGISVLDFKNQYISTREGLKYDLPAHVGEIEFITPENKITGDQNYLVGYIFVAQNAVEEGFEAWLRSLRSMEVGEEMHHGLGKIALHELELCPGHGVENVFGIPGVEANWETQEVVMTYGEPSPLLAHTYLEYVGGDVATLYGVQEPAKGHRDLLGRAPRSNKREAYWVPGTLIHPVSQGVSFKMGSNGIWYLL
ncbi:MAG: hypothetical protein GX318_03180 [Clostridia bacterium]|nr:hypothetical protein [Clostridia bacterium]